MSFSRVLTRFKSCTYTKTVCQRGLFIYPYFNIYSLRWLCHMRLSYFDPYKDLCSLIEYMLLCFELFALGFWDSLEIFMYMSLSKDLYKYAVMTFMRHISSSSEIAKLIKYLNVIASIIGEYVSS